MPGWAHETRAWFSLRTDDYRGAGTAGGGAAPRRGGAACKPRKSRRGRGGDRRQVELGTRSLSPASVSVSFMAVRHVRDRSTGPGLRHNERGRTTPNGAPAGEQNLESECGAVTEGSNPSATGLGKVPSTDGAFRAIRLFV